MTETERRESVIRWAELFNAAAYYEAHEVAEAAWFAVEGPERAFFKGLIHAAVSLCHWQRGNPHGARVKCASALAYLEPYAPALLNLDVAALRKDLWGFSRWIEATDPPAFPDPAPRARLQPDP